MASPLNIPRMVPGGFPAAMLCLLAGALHAAPSGYTEQGAFISALPDTPVTVNFDSAPANSLIPSGSGLDGVVFSYNLDGVSLKVSTVSDTAYSTTSPGQFLGTNDADLLLDGDALSLSFASSHSIGLYIITNDAMEDNDVTLSAGGIAVGLVAADIQATLADGSNVYFLGINDPVAAFTSAQLLTAGNGSFFFNIDDIVRVPVAGGMDADGDGIADGIDNCPLVPNSAGWPDPDDAGIAQRNTDSDLLGDACDPDDDNDGLTDAEEAALGTSRLNSDSDADGVSDGAEQANGTNPLLADNCDVDGVPGPSVGDWVLLQQHLAGQAMLDSARQASCDIYPDGALTLSDQLRFEQVLTAPR